MRLSHSLPDYKIRGKQKLCPTIAYSILTKVDRYIDNSNFITNNQEEITAKEYIDKCREANLLELVDGKLRVRQATKKGYVEAKDGDCIDIEYP